MSQYRYVNTFTTQEYWGENLPLTFKRRSSIFKQITPQFVNSCIGLKSKRLEALRYLLCISCVYMHIDMSLSDILTIY